MLSSMVGKGKHLIRLLRLVKVRALWLTTSSALGYVACGFGPFRAKSLDP